MAVQPLPPQPASAAGLVEWQRDAIVSRTIARAPAASITLFAFDAGQSLSEHTTPFDAFVLALAGRATITIAGTAHAVAEGDLLPLPANIPHALAATERFKMMLTMVRAGDQPSS